MGKEFGVLRGFERQRNYQRRVHRSRYDLQPKFEHSLDIEEPVYRLPLTTKQSHRVRDFKSFFWATNCNGQVDSLELSSRYPESVRVWTDRLGCLAFLTRSHEGSTPFLPSRWGASIGDPPAHRLQYLLWRRDFRTRHLPRRKCDSLLNFCRSFSLLFGSLRLYH